MAASAQGDAATALALFQEAAREQPHSGVPYFLMGAEYAALGQMGEAEAGFANAVLMEPGLTMARYQLGLLQFSSGRPALGLVTWQPLLTLGPEDPLPHLVRGFEALGHDQFDIARQHFQDGVARITANTALAEDIHRVIQEMDKVDAIKSATPPSTTPHQEVEADAEDNHTHVLLANYQQQGPLH